MEVPEAKVFLKNNSKQRTYDAKMRAQVVCPSRTDPDTNNPTPRKVCGAESTPGCNGYCNDFAPLAPGCENVELALNNLDPNRTTCVQYPLSWDDLDDSDPNQALDPHYVGNSWRCDLESGWFWCRAILLPGEEVSPSLGILNDCCDCNIVMNSIVCGELDTLAVRKPGQTSFQCLNSPNYDVVSRCEDGVIPNEKRTLFTCFTTDLNVLCEL